MEYIEEFDKLKTKVLKYILYRERTENEIRQKFIADEGEMLNDVIDELKNIGYINDKEYIEKTIREKMNLKNLSIQEIKYSLISKGIDKNLVDNYILSNKEMLLEYEINSAKNIIIKRAKSKEKDQVLNDLRKKRYLEENIKIAIHELEENNE